MLEEWRLGIQSGSILFASPFPRGVGKCIERPDAPSLPPHRGACDSLAVPREVCGGGGGTCTLEVILYVLEIRWKRRESGRNPPRGHSRQFCAPADLPGGWESLVWRLPESRREGGSVFSLWGPLWAGETEAYTQQRWDLFLQALTQKRDFRLLPRWAGIACGSSLALDIAPPDVESSSAACPLNLRGQASMTRAEASGSHECLHMNKRDSPSASNSRASWSTDQFPSLHPGKLWADNELLCTLFLHLKNGNSDLVGWR